MREENNQLRIENRKLENLKIDLENHIVVVQEKLDKVELDDRVLAAKTPPSPELKPIIERWQQASKPTRDWTKCNQLLEELNNLIS